MNGAEVRWKGGGWLICSSLARWLQLQLVPGETDVPSCDLPLLVPAVTDGSKPAAQNQQGGSFHLSLRLRAPTWVHSGEPESECVCVCSKKMGRGGSDCCFLALLVQSSLA